MTHVPAKKNDVVVVEVSSTYNVANRYAKHFYKTYYLAKVTKTDKDGVVKKYIKANGSKNHVDYRQRVMVIEDEEGHMAAKRLFLSDMGTYDFDSIEQVKDAINGRLTKH